MGGRTGELILILIVFVLLFGAQRLPEIGAAIGKAIREFKKNLRDVEEETNPSTTLRADSEKDQGVGKPADQQPK